ncbi:MAG: hypothetical protein HY211_01605 [Candidatus Omnitrophica bacterium]|nr:hypothetical protein [Candidatus Omnitrophota bacterium]
MPETTGYPKPDRSNVRPSDDLDGEADFDLGYYEGILADGRPFRAEAWWWDGIAGVTYIFSKNGLETAAEDHLFTLLDRSGETRKFPRKSLSHAGLIETKDAQGEPMWNLSFNLGLLSRVLVGRSKVIFTPDDEDDARSFEPLFREIIMNPNVRYEPSFEKILEEAKNL